jgi:hypothetical protein
MAVYGLRRGFHKELDKKSLWAYHGYHEDAVPSVVQDIFAPRNFRASLVALSLR